MDSYGGLVRLVKSVLKLTLFFELIGAFLSFLVFVQDYTVPHAIGISLFHSIAAFNNSGLIGMLLTYPLYVRLERRGREKIAERILAISDELLHETKRN